MPPSPARTTAAAAPSPNKAVATIAAGSSLSRRIEIEQVSTVTNSQLVPGSAAASRPAVAEAADPAGAAEPEHRHPPDIAAKPDPRPDPRLEAGGGDAGGRDGDDAVDLRRRQARPWRSLQSRPLRTALRRRRDRPGCARPSRAASSYQSSGATRWRRGDIGIVEHASSGRTGLAPLNARRPISFASSCSMTMGRNRGRQRE